MADPQELKPVYWVARSMVVPVGARVEDNVLSPTTESIEDARRARKQIQQRVPDAVIVRAMRFR